jgi:hypothetical protein
VGIEVWKPVVGMERFFEVSDAGRIRTVERKVRFVSKKGNESWRTKKSHIMRTQVINSGYDLVHLSIDYVRKAKTVHSVVAEAFIGPRPKGLDVCHNNGNRRDNRAENLRYDTRSANHLDRIAHGTIYGPEGCHKLTASIAEFIRSTYDGTPEFTKRAALVFGVNEHSIRKVLRKASWKYA